MVDLHNTSTYIIRYKFHDFWSQFSIQVNILRYTGLRFFFRRNLGSTHSSVQEMMQTKGDESITDNMLRKTLSLWKVFREQFFMETQQVQVSFMFPFKWTQMDCHCFMGLNYLQISDMRLLKSIICSYSNVILCNCCSIWNLRVEPSFPTSSPALKEGVIVLPLCVYNKLLLRSYPLTLLK